MEEGTVRLSQLGRHPSPLFLLCALFQTYATLLCSMEPASSPCSAFLSAPEARVPWGVLLRALDSPARTALSCTCKTAHQLLVEVSADLRSSSMHQEGRTD